MGRIFVLSLTAALNPTLLAAVTVMLTLLNPKRMLAGYLAGAAITSITCGLLLVFALHGTHTSSTAKHTVNPVINIALGALVLLVAFVVATGRDQRRRARSARKREAAKDKAPPRWKRQMSKGGARDTFVVGVLLSFPGASYIAGMGLLSKQNTGTVVTVLVVIGFNIVMLILLELPLIGYATRPVQTAAAVERLNGFLTDKGGRIALIAVTGLGILLVVRGLVNW
jgi:Sap, sulfolipid-1-addressing protein